MVELKAGKLMASVQMTVVMRGWRIAVWRITLARQLIRLAGWVAGVGSVTIKQVEGND